MIGCLKWHAGEESNPDPRFWRPQRDLLATVVWYNSIRANSFKQAPEAALVIEPGKGAPAFAFT